MLLKVIFSGSWFALEIAVLKILKFDFLSLHCCVVVPLELRVLFAKRLALSCNFGNCSSSPTPSLSLIRELSNSV